MSRGDERHRQHPAAGAEQPGDPVEAVDVVLQQVPQGDDQQVAHRVAVHLPLGGEPVLQHPRPGLAPPVVAAQGGQRHPQVAGREHAELVAQPARGAAVVGDRDHRGQVGGHAAQGGQRRRQPVATAEGDDRGFRRPAHAGYSRPRSRWVASASSPAARSRADDLLGHRDAAVLAAGAADRHGHEPLALAQVAGADRLDHRARSARGTPGRHARSLTYAATSASMPVR